MASKLPIGIKFGWQFLLVMWDFLVIASSILAHFYQRSTRQPLTIGTKNPIKITCLWQIFEFDAMGQAIKGLFN